MTLIDTQEAQQIIQSVHIRISTELISIYHANQRILAENIFTDRPLPPYDQVRMDGIAINFEGFKNGVREFRLSGIQAAGKSKKSLDSAKECLEVMTGAILPENTDTVIRYEDVTITDSIARIEIETITRGQNIQKCGSQRSSGEIIILKGTVIEAPEIGVLASIGKTHLDVFKMPKVCVISTGDELVAIEESPAEHQIRRSNSLTLFSELKKLNIDAKIIHINDVKKDLLSGIQNVAEEHDILIFSGGVSKGKFDYLPSVFKELKINTLFHGVKQRPGKPFWFGKSEHVVVFAFPGNPVSSFMCYHRYFKPWILQIFTGKKSKPKYANLGRELEFRPELSYFCLVNIDVTADGRLIAYPNEGLGSGDLANLVKVDGFLELPPDKRYFQEGEHFPLYLFRQL